MDTQPDFKELLELFNAHKVKYLIVGGYALAFHGAPRMTGDIDIFIENSEANAKNVLKALEAFGFGELGLSEKDFIQANNVIQLGQPPVRVDILTTLSGVNWEEACSTKVQGMYGSVPVGYISKALFLSNKRAMGRKKDEADIEALGED